MSRRVVVVGGGIAGLAAAWELAGAGIDVVVLEAGERAGGKLRAATVAGVAVDVGPDAFLARRPEARQLCDELGMTGDLVPPGAAGAQVWARGRLRDLPGGLVLGVPTRLGPLARSGIVGPGGVARAAADLLARRPAAGGAPGGGSGGAPGGDGGTRRGGRDRSVGELVTPRLGRAVTDMLVDPLVGGIHAGPVAAMSAAAVFPALLRAANRPGSLMRALQAGAPPSVAGDGGPVFLAPRRGMADLADRLTDRLAERGVPVRTGCPATGLRLPGGTGGDWTVDTPDGAESAAGVVLALPAPAAGALLAGAADAAGPGARAWARPGGPADSGWTPAGGGGRADGAPDGPGTWAEAAHHLARRLSAVDHAGVAVVTLAFAAGGPAERWRRAGGTGFLVPVRQGLLVTGCTWLSTKWPHLAADGPVLVRLSAGRAGDGRALAMHDAPLVRRLLAELRALAGDVDDPVAVHVTRWEEAFPQYRVGHPTWAAAAAADAAALPGLALAGAAYDGVGVPACIGTGRRAARQLAGRLQPAGS